MIRTKGNKGSQSSLNTTFTLTLYYIRSQKNTGCSMFMYKKKENRYHQFSTDG